LEETVNKRRGRPKKASNTPELSAESEEVNSTVEVKPIIVDTENDRQDLYTFVKLPIDFKCFIGKWYTFERGKKQKVTRNVRKVLVERGLIEARADD